MSPKASTSSAEVAFASMRRVAEVDRATETQLVAHDNVAGVRDRMADDGHFLTTGRGWNGQRGAHTT